MSETPIQNPPAPETGAAAAGLLEACQSEAELRQLAENVGLDLQRAVGNLLSELAQVGMRDQKSLQAVTKLSQSAVSRLTNSVRGNDPLATLSSIPGQEALRQMLKGAMQAKVSRECLAGVEGAIAGFEDFIEVRMGDRATLEAALSDWAQESRGAFELRHKTAAFKAMAALRGVQADMVLTTGILWPSATHPGRHDCIALDARLGCRRVRPSGVMRQRGKLMVPNGSPLVATNLAGQPIESLHDILLGDFSTVGTEGAEMARHDHVIEATFRRLPLGRDTQGTTAGGDLVFAQVFRNMYRAARDGGSPSSGLGSQAEPPTASFIVDVLLHDEVWPGVKPELRLHDTVVRGVAHPDDPARQGDQLEMLESIQSLGKGLAAFRLPEFPRYTELVRHACEAVGWDPARLRGYRCKVRYPIYGSQIGIAFALPD